MIPWGVAMRFKRMAGAGKFAWLVVAAGCADLAPFGPNECGNDIVEPDHGEECDTYPVGSCGAPGTSGQCRYLCTFGAPSPGCPPDFGWGADGICRRKSG